MTYCSGESDDMLMDKARATFKRENKQKPFTLEYVWKVLKKEPKWYRSIRYTWYGLFREEQKGKSR